MGMSRKRKFVYFIAIGLSVLYLLWRIFFTIPWGTNLLVLIFGLALVASEVVSNLTAYVLIIFRLLESQSQEDFIIPDYDPTQPVPRVDILIVTHNEDVELLQKTVNAATFIDYPEPEKVNIVICDDGNRSEVAALAAKYHVQYIGMEDNHEAKSGNLNHALAQLDAPLFALFDADMIPFSGFLKDTVPIFLRNFRQLEEDPDHTKPLGFIQTPQSFYNADIFQFNLFSEKIVANEQDFFSRDVNILNGHNQTALFTGSNAMFLRKAVDEVGGFPTDTITEDFELGSKINIAGYSSFATTQAQSSGTTPIDLKGVIKQRTRWARGVIQSCQNLHIFTNPKIPLLNRIILINTYLYWWSFLRRLIYIAAPILYALFKLQVVNANFWVLMIVWAPGYFLLHYVLNDASSEIRNERWGEVQETFFAPYLFFPVILETLRIRAKHFKVTQKKISFSIKDKLYILPYFFMSLVTLIAIVKFNYGKWGAEIMVGSVITFWLMMHFINLSFCVFIAMGRNVYRNAERFDRHVVGRIKATGTDHWLVIHTNDVSDSGLSFTTKDVTQVLKDQQAFEGVIFHGKVPIHFTGKIIRLIQNDAGEVTYGATIVMRAQKDRNHYMQIIYDGSNGELPKEQDAWVTPFDELNMNLTMRLRTLERRVSVFRNRA